jgi:hypothetical protein
MKRALTAWHIGKERCFSQCHRGVMPRSRAKQDRTELQGWTSDHGLVARRPQTMKQKPRSRVNRKKAKTVLRLPDLEHANATVLKSLASAAGVWAEAA